MASPMFQRRLAVLQKAKQHIDNAVAQETADGDPTAAAQEYITAMEYVTLALHEIPFESPEAQSLFYSELLPKVQEYTARADLLLHIVEDQEKEQQEQPPPPPPAEDKFAQLYSQFMSEEGSA